MNFRNKMLYKLFKSSFTRNVKFRNKHENEICYIFGNGASIKTMDMAMFSDHVSIGLNYIFLHKNVSSLNMPYCVLVHPLFFYPFFRNVYTGRIQKNTRGKLFKELMSSHPDVKVFTSISNYMGAGNMETYYMHHFGFRDFDIEKCDLTQDFSFMKGALYSAIGLAIYMGFKKSYSCWL